MTDSTTPTPEPGDLPRAAGDSFPAPGDPLAERYAELRKLGWEPSVAFLRAYRDAQSRAGRAWRVADADTTTPDGGVA